MSQQQNELNGIFMLTAAPYAPCANRDMRKIKTTQTHTRKSTAAIGACYLSFSRGCHFVKIFSTFMTNV